MGWTLQQTICNYDNKATSLLTAVGVIFGFSMFSIGELKTENGLIRLLIIIFGILYLLSFVISILFLTFIIFPRKKSRLKRQNNNLDCNIYSEDVYKRIKKEDFKGFISVEVTEEVLTDQINECARIAHVKFLLLRLATITITLMSVFLIALIILIFC